jgi:hypothetical protein
MTNNTSPLQSGHTLIQFKSMEPLEFKKSKALITVEIIEFVSVSVMIKEISTVIKSGNEEIS